MIRRAKLGEGGAPPVAKMKESAMRNVLLVISLVMAAIVILFGGDVLIMMLNGLNKQMAGETTINPASTEAWIGKGVVFFIIAVIFTKKI